MASRNLFRRNLTPQERAELFVKMCVDKLTSEVLKRRTSGLRQGATAPPTLKSAERGETAEKIATIASVGRDLARRALRAHRGPHKATKAKHATSTAAG